MGERGVGGVVVGRSGHLAVGCDAMRGCSVKTVELVKDDVLFAECSCGGIVRKVSRDCDLSGNEAATFQGQTIR